MQSKKLKSHAISMIGSGKLQPDDIELVVSLLQGKDIEPAQCIPLSYGRGLNHLAPKDIAPLLDELIIQSNSGLWAALEIIEMYGASNDVLDALFTDRLKTILVSPQLFESTRNSTMEGYHLERAAQRLIKQSLLTPVFTKALTQRMFAIVKPARREIFYEMDAPVRKVLTLLIEAYPHEVWSEFLPILNVNDPLEEHYIDNLLEPSSDDNSAAGLLHKFPADIYLKWVRENPKERAPRIAEWLPLVIKRKDDFLSWHPDIASYVGEFGMYPSVLYEISNRFSPSSWWGSIVPHLEPWLPLLQEWLEHSLPEVRTWAQQQIDLLKKEIIVARKRDDEGPVRYG